MQADQERTESLLQILGVITSHPLNREKKFDAVYRFLKWQIGMRLIGCEVVYPWIRDSRFIVRRGETGLTGNVYAGLHEFSDMGFLLHFLRAEDSFVDVGANSGSYSILAGKAIGASGYAFEPVPATFARLLQNMRLNEIEGSVKCFNLGIGKETGSIRFSGGLDTRNRALTGNEVRKDAITINIAALDDVASDLIPRLVKIDVEGYELAVLLGAQRMLKQPDLSCVILECNGAGDRYGYKEADLVSLMQGHGFQPFSYDPTDRRLIDLNGKTLGHGNTLFIRNLQMVKDRLASARKFEIFGRKF